MKIKAFGMPLHSLLVWFTWW